jgi:hypothetical protein
LIAKETGSGLDGINNNASKKILFISLSQTTQCGALVLEI